MSQSYFSGRRLFAAPAQLGSPADIAEAVARAREVEKPLTYLVAFAVANGAAPVVKRITIRDAATLVLEAINRKELAAHTRQNYRLSLRRIVEQLGDQPVATLDEHAMRRFLAAQKTAAGAPLSRHGLRDLVKVARFLVREVGMAGRLHNVATKVPVGEIEFFTVEEVRAMFLATPAELRGFLALEVFGGLRACVASRLTAENVRVDEREVYVPGSKSKTRCSEWIFDTFATSDGQVLRGAPSAMWEWLDVFGFTPACARTLQRHLAQAIGREWVQNGLRHTAATYCRALHDLDAARRLMAHTRPEITAALYGGLTSRAEATRFYALTPAALFPSAGDKRS